MMREKYESLPLATLKELAKTRGLKGISTMKKAEAVSYTHLVAPGGSRADVDTDRRCG